MPVSVQTILASKLPIGFTGSIGPIGFVGSKGITEWLIKTANYTAANLDAILADTSGGPFTVSLPTPPQANDTIIIADGANFGTNNLTVDAGTGNTIENLSQTFILDTNGAKIDFVYDGSTWQIFSTFGPKGYTGSRGEQGEPGVGTGGIGVPAGGTENQILTKNSATNYDVSWQDPPATFTTGKAIAMAIVFG